MNSFERIQKVLKGEIPDRVPVMEMWIDPRTYKVLYPDFTYYDFIEHSVYDAVCSFAGIVDPEIIWIDKDLKTFRDKWGTLKRFTEEAIPLILNEPRLKCEDDLIGYDPPDPDDKQILQSVRCIADRFKGKKAVVFVGEDVFAVPQYLRGGLENLLIDIKLEPGFVRKMIDITVEYFVNLYRNVIREGAEIIILGDDYASNTGPIMSPQDFEGLILPGLSTIVSEIKRAGAYCIKHSDGNIWPILDMIMGTGIDAIGPLQLGAGMFLERIKEKYSGICVMGNVEMDTLIRGTIEDVVKETKDCIAKVSPGGRHIISSGNTISSGVKPENLKAMLDTVMEFGNYPINI